MIRALHRLKRNKAARDLLQDMTFGVSNLIQPLFIVEGIDKASPVPGLRGTSRLPERDVERQVSEDMERGVRNFIIFFVPQEKKETDFSMAQIERVLYPLSQKFGKDANFWVDIYLCSYTKSGHCCYFSESGDIETEKTHIELSRIAVAAVDAGAYGVSPSDMIDGRVAALRRSLDARGHTLAPIMSYSTKFSSAFYGPFRVAADSAPQFGDRGQYQLDVRNRSEAIAASVRCAEEGADLLMVKPGQPAADLIAPITQETGLPVGAYQVSGEFASLSLLADNGLMDFSRGYMESLYNLRRAGARYVITYGARFAREYGLGQ